jgi:hypothetical protein
MTSKDREQIETFLRCVSARAVISLNRNARGTVFRVQLGDVGFYRWLEHMGLVVNKTHTIGRVDVPDHYFRDFLRGHLDGDGSITTYIDHYNTRKHPKYVYRRVWVRFISASKLHLEWLREKTISCLDACGRLHTVKPRETKRVPLYVLKFGKKESLKILERIYYAPTIPALSRKRKVAEQVMNRKYRYNAQHE